MNKFIPTLLRIALSSLHVAVGSPADALDDPPRRSLDLRAPDLRSLHVQNLQQVVTSADSEEAEAVTIAAAPLLLEEEPDTHLSVAGIASLYWAARHPTQAWRVFLPVQLDGHDAPARTQAGPVACPSPNTRANSAAGFATAETLTEHREISAHPSPTTLAPDTGGKSVRRTQSGEAT
jgi:hypothetical protein